MLLPFKPLLSAEQYISMVEINTPSKMPTLGTPSGGGVDLLLPCLDM